MACQGAQEESEGRLNKFGRLVAMHSDSETVNEELGNAAKKDGDRPEKQP